MVLVLALMVLAAVLLAAVFLAARPRVPVRQRCGAVPPASCLQLTALPLSDVRLYGHNKEAAGLPVSPSRLRWALEEHIYLNAECLVYIV